MSLIEQKLGAATGRLYERLAGLQKVADDLDLPSQRRALSRIVLDVLCGAYHDFRSGRPFPKGDLVEAVRAVPAHAALDDQRAAVEREILVGHYDEDDEEGRRWIAKLAPPTPGKPPPADVRPQAVELTPREYRVFVWLYRYVEVYGRRPLLREMAAGLEISQLDASGVLRALERKGAAAHIGGHRGWVPTRCP